MSDLKNCFASTVLQGSLKLLHKGPNSKYLGCGTSPLCPSYSPLPCAVVWMQPQTIHTCILCILIKLTYSSRNGQCNVSTGHIVFSPKRRKMYSSAILNCKWPKNCFISFLCPIWFSWKRKSVSKDNMFIWGCEGPTWDVFFLTYYWLLFIGFLSLPHRCFYGNNTEKRF